MKEFLKSICSKLMVLLFFFTVHENVSAGLRIVDLSRMDDSRSISLKVKLEIDSDEVDWSKSYLKRNGVVVSWPRLANGVFYIKEDNLSFGKYSYHFKVFRKNGERAIELFIPIWLDNWFRWEDGIMYQVMTDRFVNGDPSNDAPTPEVPFSNNWQGGDFKGIMNKINSGFFQKMGVNIIYISSPIINTPNKGKGVIDDRYYSAYHSYWPIGTGWTEENPIPGLNTPIDPHFGTSDELKALVNLAHQNGIRIVVDLVANHIHHDIPVYDNLPTKWFNDLFVCGFERPLRCWFTDYLPDLNYDHQEVINFVVDHALWMIKEYNLDGFRLDAVKHMNMEFTETLKMRVKNEIEHTGIPFYMVGETFTGDDEFDLIGKYLGPNRLNGQFDFPFYYHINKTFFLRQQGFRDLYSFLKENEYRYNKYFYRNAIMSTFLGNHDIPRAASLTNGDFGVTNGAFGGEVARKRAWVLRPKVPTKIKTYKMLKMAWAVLLTQPGIPLIYQGDEIGMPGAADPDNRRMMVFDNELTLKQKDLKTFVSKLGVVRRKSPALRYGGIKELWINDNVFIYSKKYQSDYKVVAINNHDYPISLDVLVQMPIALKSLQDVFTGDILSVHNSFVRINLEANEVRVLTNIK